VGGHALHQPWGGGGGGVRAHLSQECVEQQVHLVQAPRM
jgi:hypothetical protein